MANVLKRERQIDALRCLVEGNSIRSTERLTGIHRDTIMRVMVRFETACEHFMDSAFTHVALNHVQIDEIWTFVGKKQGRLSEAEKYDHDKGDIYLFTALDADTKLMPSYKLGKRTSETTESFLRDLEKRLVRPPVNQGDDRPQFSTDGFNAYPGAIAKIFGETVRHGVLIKQYSNPESDRYAPPDMCGTSRFDLGGIRNLLSICTSHVERCNLTIRTFMKRFTRLALGFSKKLENLRAATAMHIANYNFVWRLRQKGNSGKLLPPPAMQAGIVPTLWRFEDLFDAVTDHEESRKRTERYRKLAEKRGYPIDC